MRTLVGKWRLIRDGSDFMPGIDALQGAPIVLKVDGVSEVEFFKIEKSKAYESEEVILSYVTKGISVSQSYQLGTLNFENTGSPGIIMGIVQNCNDGFTEFSVSRIGPSYGQSSRELYTLNEKVDELQLVVEVISGDGTHVTLIKYFERFDDFKDSQDVNFNTCVRTLGWQLYDYWPSSILSECRVLIVKAVKVRLQQHLGTGSNGGHTKARILEVLWTRDAFHDDFYVDLNAMPRHIGAKSTEGEELVAFIIQVTSEGNTWYVAHRYSEFEILMHFLLQQNPYNNEYRQAAAEFPGKIIGMMFRRNSALPSRVEGLGKFLNFYLKNAKFGRQNTVDALCAFLSIPENLANTHRPNQLPKPVRNEVPARVTRVGHPTDKVFSSALAAASASHDHSPASSNTRSPAPAGGAGGANAQPKVSTTVVASPASKGKDEEKGKTPPKPQLQSQSPQRVKSTTALTEKPSPAPLVVPAASAPAATTAGSTYASSDAAETEQNGQRSKSAVIGTVSTFRLRNLLVKGMKIIKHGRTGYPKERVLRSDKMGSLLHWSGDSLTDQSKQIVLSEVVSIRLGTDPDPDETPAHLLHHNETESMPESSVHEHEEGSVHESETAGDKRKKLARKKSSMRFGHSKDKDKVLYGTANLRRHCKPEDMARSFSLILPSRTLDIQCHTTEDYNKLLRALREACGLPSSE